MNWAFVLIFLMATFAKAGDMPASMLRAMAGLKLPRWMQDPWVAWGHLTIQVLTMPVLMALPQIGMIVTTVLMGIYLILVVRAWGEECRCFTESPLTIGPLVVARNIGLLGAAASALAWGMDSTIGWVCLGFSVAAEAVARWRSGGPDPRWA